MSIRDTLADAASQVDGINVTPYYRQSLKPGDGFVRLASRGLDGSGLGYLDTWQIWIALHQDEVVAEKWIDQNISTITAALSPVLHVNTITPAELVLGANPVPGVIFEGVRESD